jgi:uncharacterized Zn finger protein (UPF0148 family)
MRSKEPTSATSPAREAPAADNTWVDDTGHGPAKPCPKCGVRTRHFTGDNICYSCAYREHLDRERALDELTRLGQELQPEQPSQQPDRQWASGAVRDNADNKGRYDLMASFAPGLHRVARTAQEGGRKYGDDNWLKGLGTPEGMSRAVFLDAALRHLIAATSGVEYPGASPGDDHLSQAAWNILAAMTQEHWEARMKENNQ